MKRDVKRERERGGTESEAWNMGIKCNGNGQIGQFHRYIKEKSM